MPNRPRPTSTRTVRRGPTGSSMPLGSPAARGDARRRLGRLCIPPLLASVLACLAAAPPAEAGKRRQADLAEVELGLQQVRFQPRVHGGRWEVVLSGPGEIWLRWALSPRDLSIPLAGLEHRAGGLPDGLYSWELIHTPTTASGEIRAGERQAVQAGYFSVGGGAIVQPVREEGSGGEAVDATHGAMTRQTIAEDLYVVSQACVGDACNPLQDINVKPTLTLEQDATEIFFADSSTTSFPRRKWRLRANDDFMGGGDYFAILDHGPNNTLDLVPFRIEGGAPNNSLYVETDGDVGIGTSNPEGALHVIGDAIVEGNTTIDGNFTVLSSREAKRDFSPAGGEALLARLDEMPIHTWRYRADPEAALHLGPTAEDFHAAFGLGRDARRLSPGDAAGVALAAARELSRMVRDQQAELAALRQRNADLDRRLAGLESMRSTARCVPDLEAAPTASAAR